MRKVTKWINRERLHRVAHTHGFHATHGVAHVCYFIAVMVEGHGMYALVGGCMVVFSLINVIVEED